MSSLNTKIKFKSNFKLHRILKVLNNIKLVLNFSEDFEILRKNWGKNVSQKLYNKIENEDKLTLNEVVWLLGEENVDLETKNYNIINKSDKKKKRSRTEHNFPTVQGHEEEDFEDYFTFLKVEKNKINEFGKAITENGLVLKPKINKSPLDTKENEFDQNVRDVGMLGMIETKTETKRIEEKNINTDQHGKKTENTFNIRESNDFKYPETFLGMDLNIFKSKNYEQRKSAGKKKQREYSGVGNAFLAENKGEVFLDIKHKKKVTNNPSNIRVRDILKYLKVTGDEEQSLITGISMFGGMKNGGKGSIFPDTDKNKKELNVGVKDKDDNMKILVEGKNIDKKIINQAKKNLQARSLFDSTGDGFHFQDIIKRRRNRKANNNELYEKTEGKLLHNKSKKDAEKESTASLDDRKERNQKETVRSKRDRRDFDLYENDSTMFEYIPAWGGPENGMKVENKIRKNSVKPTDNLEWPTAAIDTGGSVDQRKNNFNGRIHEAPKNWKEMKKNANGPKYYKTKGNEVAIEKMISDLLNEVKNLELNLGSVTDLGLNAFRWRSTLDLPSLDDGLKDGYDEDDENVNEESGVIERKTKGKKRWYQQNSGKSMRGGEKEDKHDEF